jgi:peptidoglycan/LPS O-acetylase OafA/YrhL
VILARIKNLIIPFIFWSVLIVLLDLLLGTPYSIVSFLLRVITGQAAGPYYFVLTLVQYLILSPVLVSLARKRYKWLLILTAVIQIATVSLRYDILLGLDLPALQPIHFLDSQRFFPSRIFFYTLGIVYGMHFSRSKEFRQRLVQARWGLFVASIVFLILGTIEWEILQTSSSDPSTFIFQLETHTDNFYALAFILGYLAFDEFTPPFPKQLEIVGGLSYGIYLTHWSVQEYISKFIYHLLPWVISYQIIMQPILIVFGLGLPILLMTIVKRSPARYYYRYLFG